MGRRFRASRSRRFGAAAACRPARDSSPSPGHRSRSPADGSYQAVPAFGAARAVSSAAAGRSRAGAGRGPGGGGGEPVAAAARLAAAGRVPAATGGRPGGACRAPVGSGRGPGGAARVPVRARRRRGGSCKYVRILNRRFRANAVMAAVCAISQGSRGGGGPCGCVRDHFRPLRRRTLLLELAAAATKSPQGLAESRRVCRRRSEPTTTR